MLDQARTQQGSSIILFCKKEVLQARSPTTVVDLQGPWPRLTPFQSQPDEAYLNIDGLAQQLLLPAAVLPRRRSWQGGVADTTVRSGEGHAHWLQYQKCSAPHNITKKHTKHTTPQQNTTTQNTTHNIQHTHTHPRTHTHIWYNITLSFWLSTWKCPKFK